MKSPLCVILSMGGLDPRSARFCNIYIKCNDCVVGCAELWFISPTALIQSCCPDYALDLSIENDKITECKYGKCEHCKNMSFYSWDMVQLLWRILIQWIDID